MVPAHPQVARGHTEKVMKVTEEILHVSVKPFCQIFHELLSHKETSVAS
jgi:hypothetical protein